MIVPLVLRYEPNSLGITTDTLDNYTQSAPNTASNIHKGICSSMLLVHHLKRLFQRAFQELSFINLFALTVIYSLVSWSALFVAGETSLTSSHNFIYWLVVTASTVGYGDFSPSSIAGKYIVGLWVIPVGLGLFAMLITKLGDSVIQIIKKGRMGLKTVNISNHIIVIGWNQQRTLKLLELLLKENSTTDSELLLCVNEEMENPLPGKIHFVRVDSFCHENDMARTNISAARSIIIDTPQDDVTLTTALFCRTANPECHKTAYFQDESISRLLKSYCPAVECVPSVSLEMLAKAAADPGSSQLHRDLLDPTVGMTQYSLKYESTDGELTVEVLFNHLKAKHNATLIAIKAPASDRIEINPLFDQSIPSGTRLYYVAEKRLSHQEVFNHAGVL